MRYHSSTTASKASSLAAPTHDDRAFDTAAWILSYARFSFPHFSFERFIGTVFLIDWKATLDTGAPAADFEWINIFEWPYEKSIIDRYPRISPNEMSHSGAPDKIISISLFVCETTKYLDEQSFDRLIHSLFPILQTNHGERIDLSKFADEYKRESLNVHHVIV